MLSFGGCADGGKEDDTPQYDENDVAQLAIYTKESADDYSSYIAESVHMAVSFDGQTY